jgi:hypothetical protein
MTTKTKEIEAKFNKRFPVIKQADGINIAKPRKFNKVRFLKAAEELHRVVKENDEREAAQS